MTKTDAAAKVSYVTPSLPEQPAAPAVPKAQSVTDGYNKENADHYKALVNGSTAKAEAMEPGVINEMLTAYEPPSKKTTYYTRLQSFLRNNFIVGDTRSLRPMDVKGNIPKVPSAEEVETAGDLRGGIARYAAEEKVLINMINIADAPTKIGQSTAVSADEIKMLSAYRSKLEEALRDCRSQREKVETYLVAKIKEGYDQSVLDQVEQEAEDHSYPHDPEYDKYHS